MAEEHENPEFLGGGPKFNTVGKDVRGEGEAIVAARQTGHWLRVALVGAAVLALALVLFFLSAYAPGRTVAPAGRGAREAAPDAPPSAPTDPNLR